MFQRARARLRLHRMTQRKKRQFAAIDTRLAYIEQTQGEEAAFRERVHGVFSCKDPRAILVPGDAVFVLHRQVPR